MEDRIEGLATDKVPPTVEEKELMGWLYGTTEETVKQDIEKVSIEFRSFLFLGLVFFVLQFELINKALGWINPIFSSSDLLCSFTKTFLFILISWIFFNLSFLKKT